MLDFNNASHKSLLYCVIYFWLTFDATESKQNEKLSKWYLNKWEENVLTHDLPCTCSQPDSLKDWSNITKKGVPLLSPVRIMDTVTLSERFQSIKTKLALLNTQNWSLLRLQTSTSVAFNFLMCDCGVSCRGGHFFYLLLRFNQQTNRIWRQWTNSVLKEFYSGGRWSFTTRHPILYA